MTVRAEFGEDRIAAVRADLTALQQDVELGTSPLAVVGSTHFARILVLPGDPDLSPAAVSPSVIYMADVDQSVERHLRALCEQAPKVVDQAFAHCSGYPDHPDSPSRLRWLQDHAIRSAASYVNTTGVTVEQVVAEAKLWHWLQAYLDEHRTELLTASCPAELQRRLRFVVAADPGVASALRPAAGVSAADRVKGVVVLAGVALAVIILLPVLLPIVLIALLAVRRLEQTDPVSTQRPDPSEVTRLRSQEDHFAYNAFAAAGRVKPGRLRRTVVRSALRAIDLSVRQLFHRGSLAGVTTIHFARWVELDDLQRIIFTSYYDGSLESYMDDFIDKLAWGLNLIFSNGVGYPRTRWLIFGGARDEQAFKDYLRCHQLEVMVSYSAYPELTCANIRNNAAIRAGLAHELSNSEAGRWLAKL